MVYESAIRLATLADLHAVNALTLASYAAWTRLLGGPPIPVTEDYAPRIENGEVWLLETASELVGLIVVGRHPDHLAIFSVAVSPGHQGKGYGRQLLDWSQKLARREGLGVLRLYTNAKMQKNIDIYNAYGFREVSRTANPHRPGWTLVNMEMILA